MTASEGVSEGRRGVYQRFHASLYTLPRHFTTRHAGRSIHSEGPEFPKYANLWPRNDPPFLPPSSQFLPLHFNPFSHALAFEVSLSRSVEDKCLRRHSSIRAPCCTRTARRIIAKSLEFLSREEAKGVNPERESYNNMSIRDRDPLYKERTALSLARYKTPIFIASSPEEILLLRSGLGKNPGRERGVPAISIRMEKRRVCISLIKGTLFPPVNRSSLAHSRAGIKCH